MDPSPQHIQKANTVRNQDGDPTDKKKKYQTSY